MIIRRILKKRERRGRRVERIKQQLAGSGRPRLCVFRSLHETSAQLIDDSKGVTIVAAFDRDVSGKSGTKTERAKAVGKILAERAKAKGVTQVVFDRRGHKYHGRVRALAEGAREGGLQF